MGALSSEKSKTAGQQPSCFLNFLVKLLGFRKISTKMALSLAKSFRHLTSKSLVKAAQRSMSAKAGNLGEFLLNVPPTDISVLDNGMRVATENSGASTATPLSCTFPSDLIRGIDRCNFYRPQFGPM